MYIILSIILAIIGIVLIHKPWFIYNLTESWKHDGKGEPSGHYITNARISGYIFATVGMITAIVLVIVQ